ncbi:MAG: hypothetical protein IJ191_03815 [Treponema sp.]|nr:hypothetical protein [Treponema sp.]
MYLFFLKKNFCDGWDNLFLLVAVNALLLIFTALCSVVLYAVGTVAAVASAIVVLWAVGTAVLCLAYGEVACLVADFKGVTLADYFRAIPASLADGIRLGLIGGVSLIAVPLGTYFYFSLETFTGFLLGALVLWVALFEAVTLQWFVAVRSLLHCGFTACLKKCLFVAFDNMGFSFFMLMYDSVLAVLSIIPGAGLAPSGAGIVLAKVNALRLRLYKYDYLAAHPECTTPQLRRKIPWDTLVAHDRETLGPRPLSSFFFPWKG